jgi:hypothetical protein
MNPIELYKLLPKKNCGECEQRKCMPFALSLIKGEANLTECPYLTPGAVEEIKTSLKKSDWREDLILSLKQDVSKINFSEIAEGLGAKLKEGYLIINCLGREFRIDKEGEIFTNGPITSWIKILLLYYIKLQGKGDLSGKWVSFSELKSGLFKASSFQRDCEEPLQQLLENNFEIVDDILKRLGARKIDSFPTENAWLLYLLPKIPIVTLFWPKDEDFGSKLKILFDSTADRFLDAESIIFLVEGLVKNIEYILQNTKNH